ncbi:MAG TPA: outer membrane protein transport protein [Aliidongia sp.]|uniref:OmpP1/FadL family transporter n=1 Tax=Aliidongia sp. TaxID=1914230 RepID=UPI002DDD8D28|nr:outer membrane protein transport protein [Aliidongia sp.]HEV2673750.1 outer membrane protein transport protein [Aliidongia sp.]
MKFVKPALVVAIGAVATVCTTTDGQASGFGLRENSAVGTGESYAGAVSGNYDLSTIYNNPAGMTAFTGIQQGAAATLIDPSGHLSNVQGHNIYGAGITDSDERDPTQAKVIPSAYLLWAPTDDWRIGLAMTVPFGLITSYSGTSAVRYQALESEIESLDINPNVAYKVNDWISLGGGVTVEKVKAKLTNALDLGGIVGSQLDAIFHTSTLGAAMSQTADGRSDVVGTSWGVGYNVGIQLKPWGDDTTIGLAYRSGIHQKLSGRADFTVPGSLAALVATTGELQKTGATADLSLPGNAWIGITHQFTPALSVSASYQYTQWSSFKTLEINFENPKQPSVIDPENYRDSSFVSLGADYKVNDRLTVRAGTAFDQTPIQDRYRDYRLPDGNRYWVSGGATYQLTDSIAISAAYLHVFIDSSSVKQTDINPIFDTVSAQSNIAANLVSLSASMKF